MSDLISRQAAIDEVRNYYDPEDTSVTSIEDRIKRLPSAQPKTQLSTEDTTLDTTFDCISRQAAIDAVIPAMVDGADADLIEGMLYLLPSAQPEIIYCKDCTRYEKKNGRCNLVEGLNVATANSFCSYGERKE